MVKKKKGKEKKRPRRLPLRDLIAGAEERGAHAATLKALGDRSIWWITTGNPALDRIIGDGIHNGIGSGLMYLLWGMSRTGKTLQMLCIAKAVIEAGGIPIFVDMERTASEKMARDLDFDSSKLWVIPNEEILADFAERPIKDKKGKVIKVGMSFAMEDAFDQMEKFLLGVRARERKYALEEKVEVIPTPVVFLYDSIATSTTRMRDQANYGDSRPAHIARCFTDSIQQFRPRVIDHHAACVFSNHQKLKLGIVFGDDRTQPGGKAVEFYMDVTAHLALQGSVKDGDTQVGEIVKVKIDKNRLDPGRPSTQFRILYDLGIDVHWSIAAMAIDYGLVQKNGSWYQWGKDGDKSTRAQGEASFVTALRDDKDLYNRMHDRVMAWVPERTGTLVNDTKVEAVQDETLNQAIAGYERPGS